MVFEDYKTGVFESIAQSSYYANDRDRQLVIGALRLFFDISRYDDFFNTYEVSKQNYKDYFEFTFKKYLKRSHKTVKKILKYEEKFNESK